METRFDGKDAQPHRGIRQQVSISAKRRTTTGATAPGFPAQLYHRLEAFGLGIERQRVPELRVLRRTAARLHEELREMLAQRLPERRPPRAPTRVEHRVFAIIARVSLDARSDSD